MSQSTASFLAQVRAKQQWAKVEPALQVQIAKLLMEPATCPSCGKTPIPVDITPIVPVVERAQVLLATLASFICPDCRVPYRIERKGTLSGALQRALFAQQREKRGQPPLAAASQQETPCAG